MKNVFPLLVLLVSFMSLHAQTEGVIHYEKVVKLDLNLPEGVDMPEEIIAMIPESQSYNKELIFDSKHSVFRDGANEAPEDIDVESENISVTMKFAGDEVEDILYRSFLKDDILHQTSIMGKAFLVEGELEKIIWKLTNDKIIYLGYECQKAVGESEGEAVVAWFTSQIPASVGPGSFTGLPGAILMVSVNEGASEYKATKIDMSDLADDAIMEPKEGKRVTTEEYKKIKDEKIKEMSGNGTFISIGG